MTQTPAASLGRLERVDLRTVWFTEAGDFPPWLALDENIVLLGEAIGIELEVQSTEKGVGPYRADILCRDTLNNHFVLIENQLEGTDHTHMGQLITYAAGLDAVTIVWVAQRFTEEHRAALDWLNSQTSEDLNFFGLEIEVWRIGDSQPAPKFNIVSKPNDWTKTVRGRARESSSGELTTIQQLHLDFWTQFKEYLETHNASSHIGTPSKDHWRLFPIGRSYFALSATNGMKDGWSAFSLVMSGPDGEAHFQLIRDHHGEEIEQRFGPIKWEPLPGKGEKRITVMRDESPADPQKWPELNAWFMEHLERWGAFLRPIVKNLDASDWTQPPENLLSEAI